MLQLPHTLSCLACLLTLSLIPVQLYADTATGTQENIVSPAAIDGATNVDAEGLIGMVVQHSNLVLVDSRILSDRNEGYIEGSVSLPDTDTDCAALAEFAPVLDAPVIFYCNGIRCGRSAKAAVIARDCGYRNLFWFRTGMVEWQEKQYPLVQ